MIRAALVIAGKELRQRVRDRSALVAALLMPLVISAIVGTSLGQQEAGLRVELLWVDLDGSDVSAGLRGYLESDWRAPVFEVDTAQDAASAEAAVDGLRAHAGLVVPAGFGAGLVAGDPPPVRVFVGPRNVLAARSLESLVDLYGREVRDGPGAGTVARPAAGRMRVIDYFATSMSVLFLNFAILSGVFALQREKEDGTLARLVAAPIHPGAVLLGKFGALFGVGLAQMGVMVAASTLLFGTRWGSPGPVAALVTTSVLMSIGLMACVVSWVNDAQRGRALASILIFLLGVVGGQFLPPAGLPDVFETLQRLTPNGQAARGFAELSAAGASGTLGTVLEPLAVTAAVGVVGIAIAGLRARDALTRIQ